MATTENDKTRRFVLLGEIKILSIHAPNKKDTLHCYLIAMSIIT